MFMFLVMIIVGAATGYSAARMGRVGLDLQTASAVGAGGGLLAAILVRWVLSLFTLAAGLLAAIVCALVLIWFVQKFMS
jgi:hypothetical protein